MRRLEGLHYLYAEYCPGDFFWGWWLYTAPLIENKPDRTKYTWLNYDWRLDAVLRLMGHTPQYDHRGKQTADISKLFLHFVPLGIVCNVQDDGRTFVHDTSYDECLWDFSRIVREAQLLDWKKEAQP